MADGVVEADARPVRTVGEGSTLGVGGGTNCSNWTSVAASPTYFRNYGDATQTSSAWRSRGNYVGCDSASYVFCVGH